MTALALRLKAKPSIFFGLLFIYFFTTSADVLNIPVKMFYLKFSHVFSALLFIAYFLKYKVFEYRGEILRVTIWLLLAMIISVFFSPFKMRTIGYIGVYLLEFFCFFLLPMNLILKCDEERLLKVYWASFIAFGGYAFIQVVAALLGYRLPLVTGAKDAMIRANSLAYEVSFYVNYMILFITFVNAGYLLYGNFRGFSQVCRLFFYNVLLIISTSTLGFLSYFILVPLLLFFNKFVVGDRFDAKLGYRLRRLALVLGAFITALTLYASLYIKSLFFKFFSIKFMTHHSFAERWVRMENAFKAFLDYPIFGLGLGGVGPYLYKLDFGSFNPLISSKGQLIMHDPCVVFAEVISSLGIFGSLAFCYLFVFFWKRFKQVLRLETESKHRQTIILMVFSMVMALILVQVNQGIFRSYLWVHAALIYGYMIKRLRILHS